MPTNKQKLNENLKNTINRQKSISGWSEGKEPCTEELRRKERERFLVLERIGVVFEIKLNVDLCGLGIYLICINEMRVKKIYFLLHQVSWITNQLKIYLNKYFLKIHISILERIHGR